MSNIYVNQVIVGSDTLLDLTSDTITPDRLYSGFTAHGADGSPIIGTLSSAPIGILHYDYNIGYISSGSWIYENPTRTYTDIYEAVSGHRYLITLGGSVGSRFRAMFTTTDITTITSGTVSGTQIVNQNNPAKYANASFTASADGYILVAKDNVGVSGLHSYVYDGTEAWP